MTIFITNLDPIRPNTTYIGPIGFSLLSRHLKNKKKMLNLYVKIELLESKS